jgi:hypothetical protein
LAGNCSHWQPLRIRKRMALSMVRQWATRRPVGLLGQNSLRMGSILCQRSSGTSQIVPRGLSRDFLRAIARTPVVRPGGGESL